MAKTGKDNVAGCLSLCVLRACFGLVFCLNVTCALQFVFTPDAFVSAYELSGVPGSVAIRGMGIAFLMWNATYPAFIVAPQRFGVLGLVILAQQAIGLVGECCILVMLPVSHDLLAASILRFVVFDGLGLVLMSVSLAWATHVWKGVPRLAQGKASPDAETNR